MKFKICIRNTKEIKKKKKKDQGKEEGDFRTPLFPFVLEQKYSPAGPSGNTVPSPPHLICKDFKEMTPAAYWELKPSAIKGASLMLI